MPKTPTIDKPMPREEYDALSAYEQGYVSYMRAEWSEWQIPKTNPFASGTVEAHDWNNGSQAAVLECQDIDE